MGLILTMLTLTKKYKEMKENTKRTLTKIYLSVLLITVALMDVYYISLLEEYIDVWGASQHLLFLLPNIVVLLVFYHSRVLRT